MLTLTSGDHPDKIIYKQTYRIKGCPNAGQLLAKFNDHFGNVDVVGYHACGTDDPHGSTSPLVKGAKFWNVFGEKDDPDSEARRQEPEERVLHCIAMSGEGKAFIDLDNADGGTPSPGELLETILHAIIGK